MALCLSTPRVSILHQQVKGQQEELQARSTELGSALVKVQVEADHWQARFCQLEEEHQAASASLAQLRKQCEVRPGGPGQRAVLPGLRALGWAGSEWVLVGVLAQRLYVNVTQRPRGSQRHLKGTNTLTVRDVSGSTFRLTSAFAGSGGAWKQPSPVHVPPAAVHSALCSPGSSHSVLTMTS